MIGGSSRWPLFTLETKLIGGEWRGFVVGLRLWVRWSEVLPPVMLRARGRVREQDRDAC